MEREKSDELKEIIERLEVIHADLLETRKENFGEQVMSFKYAELKPFSLEEIQQENRYEKMIKKSRLKSAQSLYYKRVVEKSGIIISTCGGCGAVLLLQEVQEKITCHSCMEEQETKDCPDLW